MTPSTKYRAIAEVAYFLEQHHGEKSFDLLDGGLTLDILSATLFKCRQNPDWESLEAGYESVGGNINCTDEDLYWEVG